MVEETAKEKAEKALKQATRAKKINKKKPIKLSRAFSNSWIMVSGRWCMRIGACFLILKLWDEIYVGLGKNNTFLRL